MLIRPLLGHAGAPLRPHDLWSAWSFDLVLLTSLVALALVYVRGVRVTDGARRRAAFLGALTLAGLAVLSPLDALSAAFASAHMAQHLVLHLVVAPLLVAAAPVPALLRGSPRWVRSANRRLRRAVGGWHPSGGAAPVAAGVAVAGSWWVWHARGAYELALRNSFAHHLEHACFLVAAVLLWSVVARGLDDRRARPLGAFGLLFVVGLQGTVLAALLTFSDQVWYPGLPDLAWGPDPLTDQKLAGLIMWFPSGLVYLICGLGLLFRQLTTTNGPAPLRRGPLQPTGDPW